MDPAHESCQETLSRDPARRSCQEILSGNLVQRSCTNPPKDISLRELLRSCQETEILQTSCKDPPIDLSRRLAQTLSIPRDLAQRCCKNPKISCLVLLEVLQRSCAGPAKMSFQEGLPTRGGSSERSWPGGPTKRSYQYIFRRDPAEILSQMSCDGRVPANV